MTPARIADLLEPFLASPLSDGQLAQISTYIDLLLRWNARINLTAIRDPESIVTRHFGESLFAAQTLFPPSATAAKLSHSDVGTGALTRGPQPARFSWDGVVTRPAEQSSAESDLTSNPDWAQFPPAIDGVTGVPARPAQNSTSPSGAFRPDPDSAASLSSSELSTHPKSLHAPIPRDLLDLGSGPGFPGLPIKFWAPHLCTTLLESQNKKVAFLREVIRSLTLTDIDVLPARAGAISAKASVVTLRAVENFDSILPVALNLVAPQGRLALLIGESQIARAHHLCPTVAWDAPFPIPQSSTRVLQTAVVP